MIVKTLVPILILCGLLAMAGPDGGDPVEECVQNNLLTGYVLQHRGRITLRFRLNGTDVVVDRPSVDGLSAEQELIEDVAREIAHELSGAL